MSAWAVNVFTLYSTGGDRIHLIQKAVEKHLCEFV